MIPFLNFSSRLQLTCDNSVYGCTAVLKLDALESHVQECEFNPKRPVPCELGCGLVVPKDELKVSMVVFKEQQATVFALVWFLLFFLSF